MDGPVMQKSSAVRHASLKIPIPSTENGSVMWRQTRQRRAVLPMLFRISFPETKGIIGSLSREGIRQQREDLKFREIQ